MEYVKIDDNTLAVITKDEHTFMRAELENERESIEANLSSMQMPPDDEILEYGRTGRVHPYFVGKPVMYQRLGELNALLDILDADII